MTDEILPALTETVSEDGVPLEPEAEEEDHG